MEVLGGGKVQISTGQSLMAGPEEDLAEAEDQCEDQCEVLDVPVFSCPAGSVAVQSCAWW